MCTASGHYPLGVKVKIAQACELSMKFIKCKKKEVEKGKGLATCWRKEGKGSAYFCNPYGVQTNFCVVNLVWNAVRLAGSAELCQQLLLLLLLPKVVHAWSAPQATAGTPVAPPAVHKLHSRYFYLL